MRWDYYKQSMNQLSQRVTEIREQYQQRQRRRGKPDEEEGRSNKPEEPSQQAAQQQQDSDASGGEAPRAVADAPDQFGQGSAP
ncbi:MAG: hypothetical protein R2857_04750 [Vampirovibrionales bacterium]